MNAEFKVGLFVFVCLSLVVFGYYFTVDGLTAGESSYQVTMRVPSAEGLFKGTAVKLAGVEVGAVDHIELQGNQALVFLDIRSEVILPADSKAELRSSGLLGDRHVALDPGHKEAIIQDGGKLEFGEPPGDIDEITRQVEKISEDVSAITSVVRDMVEDDNNRDHVESTLANVDALSAELRMLAERNRQDIDAIVSSVRRLTEHLADASVEATDDLDEEFDKLKSATDKLDSALADVQSITSKINDGEGTIGALINDRRTIDSLNETIENANEVIESFSGLETEVYYIGRLYIGGQPNSDAFFYGNPLAPNLAGGLGYSGANTLGIELHPQEDFWWVFEINDHPAGTLVQEQHYFEEQGTFYTEWIHEQNYRFTFQLAKRFWNLGLRLGVKESGGGVGATYYAVRDRVEFNVDVFDFAFGSFPDIASGGLPNMRVGVRVEPVEHVWLETGAEQVLLGIKRDYATGYIGGGFHFSDNDIKLLFATLPLGL